MSCESNSNRFDIKSSEFQKKSSHHYYELFVDSSKILLNTNSEEDGESQIAGSISNNQIFEIQDELHNEGFINSLINERNQLLRQLDSLQTNLTISRRTSNDQIKQIEVDNNKLQTLINILSREIE